MSLRTIAIASALILSGTAFASQSRYFWQPPVGANAFQLSYSFTDTEATSYNSVYGGSFVNLNTKSNSFNLSYERGLAENISAAIVLAYSLAETITFSSNSSASPVSGRGIGDITLRFRGRTGETGLRGYFGADFSFSPDNARGTIDGDGNISRMSGFSGGQSVSPYASVMAELGAGWDIGVKANYAYHGNRTIEIVNASETGSPNISQPNNHRAGGQLIVEKSGRNWAAALTNGVDFSGDDMNVITYAVGFHPSFRISSVAELIGAYTFRMLFDSGYPSGTDTSLTVGTRFVF